MPQLASIVPIAPDVAMPSMPPKATAGARQAKNRKKIEDRTFVSSGGGTYIFRLRCQRSVRIRQTNRLSTAVYFKKGISDE